MTHLDHLIAGLHRDKQRLASAATESERALRRAWIAQSEREIAGERQFLGAHPEPEMTDADILSALGL